MRFRQRVTASTWQGEIHTSRGFGRNSTDALKPETCESLCRDFRARKKNVDQNAADSQ
jgi:hypothetical protein